MITGPNGTGKTSVLEALAYLGTRRSFRGAPPRGDGAHRARTEAIVRAEFDTPRQRRSGRGRDRPDRAQPHPGQPQGRRAGAPRPGRGRAVHRSSRPRTSRWSAAGRAVGASCSTTPWPCSTPKGARAADEIDRVLRQRAALLRQSGGRASAGRGRHPRRVGPAAGRRRARSWSTARERLAGRARAARRRRPTAAWPGRRPASMVAQRYRRSWDGDLLDGARRPPGRDDLRRGVNTVGPHRDDLRARARRPRGPDPRLPGRAALPGPGPAPRDPPAGRGRGRRSPRRCSSTTSSPSSTRRAAGPWWPSCPPGQSILTTAAPLPAGIEVARGRIDAVGRRRERAGVSGRARRRPRAGVTPGRNAWPRPCLERARALAGIDAAPTMEAGVRPLGGDRRGRTWPGICGPLRLRRSTCSSSAVDHPAWATRARMESAHILDACAAALGDTPIERLEVRRSQRPPDATVSGPRDRPELSHRVG